jgi:hypothetical protein
VSNSNNNNNYIYAIYHAETEDEVRAIALNELYERTRQKVKASGGINTQQQAMEERNPARGEGTICWGN